MTKIGVIWQTGNRVSTEYEGAKTLFSNHQNTVLASAFVAQDVSVWLIETGDSLFQGIFHQVSHRF